MQELWINSDKLFTQLVVQAQYRAAAGVFTQVLSHVEPTILKHNRDLGSEERIRCDQEYQDLQELISSMLFNGWCEAWFQERKERGYLIGYCESRIAIETQKSKDGDAMLHELKKKFYQPITENFLSISEHIDSLPESIAWFSGMPEESIRVELERSLS